MIKTEGENCAKIGYMGKQSDINEKMRAILVDWLIEVHHKFQFEQETLHLTINLIDRYLSRKVIQKERFQLLGVACLLISAKYEEIYREEISDFIYITDYAYTIADLIRMEKEVLQVVDYCLTVTTSNKLLEMAKIIFALEETEYNLARYFLEIFSIDYRMTNYSQSVIAFACLYLVNTMYRNEEKFFVYCNVVFNEIEVKNCAKEILFLYENIFTSSLQTTRNKFSKKEFSEVARLKLTNSMGN